MTAATGDSLSFGYDALKRLNRVTVKNGSSVILNTAYAYRDVSWNRGSAQVEFRNVRLGSDSGMLLEGKKYVYDDVGNLKEIRESTGDFSKLVEYAYDSQNQLTSEAYYKSGEAKAYITYNYTYDTAGNLLTVSQKKGNTTTLLQTYTYGDAQWHDLLTAVNGQAITYDASGNPLSYGGWSFGWQNGRQLKTASKTSDGKTETLEYAYDADGIRTSKTYTVETFTQLPDYTVTFQADGATVKTMTVEDGYTLKDSDYPAVPTKTGYTGEWVKYTSAMHSNVTVQAKYTAVSTDHTVTFKANGKTVKTMVVPDGYVLQDSDYPPIPPRVGYKGSWSKVTTAIRRDTVIYASYMPNGGGIVIPTQPTSPGEIMSGGEGEPVEADVPAEDETVAPQEMHVTGTQTVTHEYLTLNGKVARETIRTNNTLTAVLDFIYDESGKPFALKYSTNGTSFQTYYYVLNLQGDVVKLIHYIPGFEYESVATYEYDAWGNILSSSGKLAEINPLRYRGYYYDSETGFYYLQSRYYDPANRRFISADSYQSTGQGFIGTNMFAYCGNSPTNLSDNSGCMPHVIENAADWINSKIIQPAKNCCSLSIQISAEKSTPRNQNYRPYNGVPGSTYTAPNGDSRTYGPDGTPEHDYDHDDHGYPEKHPHDANGGHNHDWENGVRGPAYSTARAPVAGIVVTAACLIGIVIIAVDDTTGIGIADDFLLGPLGAGLEEGLRLITG